MAKKAKISVVFSIVFCLLVLTCNSVWANRASNNQAIGIGGQVIGGDENDVQGIGGLTLGGRNNIAMGIGGQVISGNNNYVRGIGGISGGLGNAATGIGAQMIGADDLSVSGIGAISGMGSYNTAVGIGVQIIGDSEHPVTGGILESFQDSAGNAVSGQGAQIENGSYNRVAGCTAQAGYGDGNTAIGAGAQAGIGDGNTAVGIGSQAYGMYNTAVGTGAIATGGNSVAIGTASVADRPNTVSVGAPDNERQITNVAPGSVATDAVNVSQLNSGLAGMNSKINRVGASALALSALAPMPYDPKAPTQYSAGIGTYDGEHAIAFGVFHYTKESVMLNMAFAISSDGWEKAARFGVTWKVSSAGKAKKVLGEVKSTQALS